MSTGKGSHVVAQSINKSRDITDFFPEAKGNLTKITWAHAVNSQELLNDALNGTVMMLEADIVLGRLNGSSHDSDIPIMAHPPQNISDLSLKDFLQKVQDFNMDNNNTAKKGVKLDFKSIEVFEVSVDFILDLYPKMNYPVWLNADILPGPFNSTDLPVNATRFISAAKPFVNSTLSLGWKTVYGNDTKGATYTENHIDEMLDVIKENNVTQLITFPVRAAIAAESSTQLKKLVSKVEKSTLTLWNGADDDVSIENLRKLIANIGIDKVFIDLPDEIKDKLRLDKLSGNVGTIKPLTIVTLACVMLLTLL
ncbi:hypothetical protein ILUMI_24078 [Ignelater luminosus]|uniref:Menorin-like domain-containing protein n=1 Tax=Ignelater luminosus TaxID=2038154 RepID=A0A8K0FWP4_IGNLU|nr:hypothetical protein ILUMI_24078 [Ignelater luminosus]